MFRLVVNHASSVQSYDSPNAPTVGYPVTSLGTVGVTARFLNLKLSIVPWNCSFLRNCAVVPLLPGILPICKSLFPKERAIVSLLNIGSEEIKGTETLKKTFRKLSELSDEIFRQQQEITVLTKAHHQAMERLQNLEDAKSDGVSGQSGSNAMDKPPHY